MTAYDAVGPAGGTGISFSTSPGTWTHVNSGNAILIGVTVITGSTNTITSVTYGGVTIPLLLFIQSGTGASGGIALYGLQGATVPTGSNTVSVAFSDAANHNAGSVSLTAAGGFGTVFSAQAATASTSVSVAVTNTTTGGMIVATACFGGGAGSGVFSGTNSVTVRWQKDGSNTTQSDNGVEGTVPSTGGGASQTVGFSNSSVADNWGLLAVEVLPAAGISSVQSNSGNVASTSIPVTLTAGATLGNLLVVCLSEGNSVVPGLPARWTASTTFQALASTVGGGQYYLVVGASDAGATSFTFTLATSHSVAWTIREWNSSTGWPVNPIDAGTGANLGGSNTVVTTGTTAATTQAQELAVAELGWVGSLVGESGLSAGWTSGVGNANSTNNAVREAYRILAATGTQQCQETLAPATQYAATIATYKTAAAAPASLLPQQVKKRMPATFTRLITSRQGGVYSR